MRRIIREPLLHFLLIGVFIFFAASFITNKNRKSDRTITIGNDKVVNIVRLYQIQTGTLPTKSQLDAMIEDYIREEVYYRESLKMKLDKDDEIIRRRLSQKMEFLQSDLASVPAPSWNQLEIFYQSHPGLFRDSGLVSFTHIYFNADNGKTEEAKKRALAVKAQLIKSNSSRAPQMGDSFSLLFDYSGQNKLDVVQLFGNKPILDSLFESPVNQWIGPVESGYGWHLIRIIERKQPQVPPYASVKEKVQDEYIASMKDSLNKSAYEKLKNRYTIRRDYLNEHE